MLRPGCVGVYCYQKCSRYFYALFTFYSASNFIKKNHIKKKSVSLENEKIDPVQTFSKAEKMISPHINCQPVLI